MSETPVPLRTPLPHALAGQTVVVAGGSSGIGLAAGVLLRTIGARVVVVARDEARLAAAAAVIRAAAPGPDDIVVTAAADASEEDALRHALDPVDSIDHVLVTAGTLAMGPLAAIDRKLGAVVVNSRLWAAYAAARVTESRLPAGGSLTFVSGDFIKRPLPGTALAAAGLGAIEALTRGLAVELASRRIRVNAIRAGSTDTPLIRAFLGHGADPGTAADGAILAAGAATPLGRLGSAEEVAAAAVFLMANPYVTGSVLTVDGGQTLA